MIMNQSMHYYWLLLSVLAVWRITHLFAEEDGPWDLLFRLRRAAGEGFWATLLDCFHCLSLWVALPFAFGFGRSWIERLVLWPAISGAAILLERITRREPETPPAIYLEDEEAWIEEAGKEEERDGMLR